MSIHDAIRRFLISGGWTYDLRHEGWSHPDIGFISRWQIEQVTDIEEAGQLLCGQIPNGTSPQRPT